MEEGHKFRLPHRLQYLRRIQPSYPHQRQLLQSGRLRLRLPRSQDIRNASGQHSLELLLQSAVRNHQRHPQERLQCDAEQHALRLRQHRKPNRFLRGCHLEDLRREQPEPVHRNRCYRGKQRLSAVR